MRDRLLKIDEANTLGWLKQSFDLICNLKSVRTFLKKPPSCLEKFEIHIIILQYNEVSRLGRYWQYVVVVIL